MSTEREKLLFVRGEMISRCTKPSHKQYKNYGGRGITVCARWLNSAKAFLDDMGERPVGGMIDRIDNNGPYSPENCRWATRKEQNSNRRNCIYVDCDGETVTLRELCRRRGLKYRPIVKRIKNRGWPIERAISEPLHNMKAAA